MRLGPHTLTPLRPGMPILTLAPMAGISNWAFRLICAKMGARMVGVEFINCNAILHHNLKTALMMNFSDVDIYRSTGLSLLAAQIYGNDIEKIVEGALILEERGAQVMDINFGCSVPKVLQSQSGAAFLKDLDRMMETVRRVATAVRVPVIIKTRLGWDSQSVCIVDIVRRAPDVGAQAVAIHARTVTQKFTGKAAWEWIARAKEAATIPILGNGDVFTYDDAVRMVRETGCDAVMIARAARDCPWIFSGPGVPSLVERIALAKEHLRLMVEYKGEVVGVREMRKHFASYFKGFPNASKLRSTIVLVETVEEAHRVLDGWLDEQGNAEPVGMGVEREVEGSPDVPCAGEPMCAV